MKDRIKDYDSFVFYGSWRELLKGFDEVTAKEILWQVMLYGTDGELTTKDKMIEGIVLGAVAPNIRRAMDRYNKAITDGRKGGRSKIELPIDEIIVLREKGTTLGEIARLYECSVDTVTRRIKEYRAELQNRKNFTAIADSTAKPQQNLEKEIEKEIDSDCDSGFCPHTTTTKEKKERWNF